MQVRIKEEQQQVNEILSGRSGRSMEEIEKLNLEKKIFGAEEAKALGFIDEII